MTTIRRSVVGLALTAALAWGLATTRAANDDCRESEEVRIWTSPRSPIAGGPLRILAVSTAAAPAHLTLSDGSGREIPLAVTSLDGPPWSLTATLDDADAGSYRVEVDEAATRAACQRIHVGPPGTARGAPSPEGGWDEAYEAFYSAWIERLFDAPPDVALGFPRLDEALHDPARNFLHDHLGLGEDDAGKPSAVVAAPDCADLPYFLRAYFGWKVGLPFGFRACSRGTSEAPPRCGNLQTHDPAAHDSLAWFKQVARTLMDTVQSGSARTALEDDATDFYPVALSRTALRPGVIYADPYGHTLMIVKWVPQTAERSGLLLAVDAQPDNSVGRKRFWEGTFIFADDVPSAGPGFKAFRPLVGEGAASLHPLANAALTDDVRFAPYSAEQGDLTPEEFYARLGRLIDPDGLEPARAYDDALDALVEQVETRVGSVDNGETFARTHPNTVISMPEGAAIFETVGPWEDYATPSRDWRLLIAMKVLADLPERIVRHPELFVLDGRRPEEVRDEIQRRHAQRIGERAVTYTRSDGSPWKLTVADLFARQASLQMAYNPNDCVELRWGAADGAPEYATCRRHAPQAQRTRMAEYRGWFRESRRPAR